VQFARLAIPFELSMQFIQWSPNSPADIFDITNDEGPASIPVNVTYSPPAAVILLAPVGKPENLIGPAA